MKAHKERAKIEAYAEKLLRRGKIQDAIQEYQKLLKGDDSDIPIRNIIGDLFVKSHQAGKGIEEFKKIADLYKSKGLDSKVIATLKRINRIDAHDLESVESLAQLYQKQGFTSEAKTEYLKLANSLKSNNENKKAIQVYDKLIKLSPEDMETRLILAELYCEEQQIERALMEFNNVAEFNMKKNELKEARKILIKARELKGDDQRTLTNLIELFKLGNKKKEALSLVKEILKKDKDNVKALYLLGNLYYEDNNFDEAQKVFSNILSTRPKETEATVKLGKIFLQKDKIDKAFDLYEPLVETLTRKHKLDQAIGLLGLILQSNRPHVATLEKLASVLAVLSQPSYTTTLFVALPWAEASPTSALQARVLDVLGRYLPLELVLLVQIERVRRVEVQDP